MTASFRLPTLVLLLAVFASAQQPLGDVARQTRSQLRSARVITNEDLPHAMVPAAPVADKPADKEATKAAADEAAPAEVRKELESSYLARYASEKQSLDLLTRELNVLQRESQIKTAEYYADAGTRLRDPRAFYEGSKQYADDIAAKQKAIEAAKQKLDTLKEEARKAGLPMRLFDE